MALALGAIVLVRYTIQEGLIGPGVRIILGALLALILVAAGEWTRRKDNLSGLQGLPTAHIPSILTATGSTVAYARIYAAYGLYDFFAPGVAFVLLGVAALLTLAAALLHGPALAGLAVIGSATITVPISHSAPDGRRCSALPDIWRSRCPMIVAAITAMTLALFYLTLEVRRLFHGPVLAGATSDAEQYLYSMVWLSFGNLILTVGFFLRSQPARLLVLGVIGLTIAKVFIIDGASISGIFRALSASDWASCCSASAGCTNACSIARSDRARGNGQSVTVLFAPSAIPM